MAVRDGLHPRRSNRKRSLLLAQSGHTARRAECPLSGVKRTSFREKRTSRKCPPMTQSGHHISRWNDSYSSRLAGAAFEARHPRYSVAVGGEDGSRASPGASSEDGPEGFLGTHAEEHFVEKKPERSCRLGNSAQLYATTPIDEASFWLMPLRFNSILLYRPQVDRPLE